ncbi:MAG: hypothetical protein Ct9H300mP16_07830 [Pseudomonadota bacterium]|nr:MAG: hypothetical protein Ct9H300mP16_07830 [Pseudomonadota bacterium]
MNMVTPIEMVTAVIDGMVEREFGRIVNITSISVKKPVFGLDLSSGRGPDSLLPGGVSRSVANSNVTINNICRDSSTPTGYATASMPVPHLGIS